MTTLGSAQPKMVAHCVLDLPSATQKMADWLKFLVMPGGAVLRGVTN